MTFKRAKQDKFSGTNHILTQYFYQQPRLSFKVTQLLNDYVPFIFVFMVICLVLLSSFRRLKLTDIFRETFNMQCFLISSKLKNPWVTRLTFKNEDSCFWNYPVDVFSVSKIRNFYWKFRNIGFYLQESSLRLPQPAISTCSRSVLV